MFNLQKQSFKQEDNRNIDKKLKDNNKEWGLKAPKVPVGTEKLLGERKEKAFSVITEKQFKKPKKEVSSITEKQMLKTDREDRVIIAPMDQGKIYDHVKASEFQDGLDNLKRDTSFWDDYVGKQMLGEEKKQVDNVQPSQLLSNYDSRKEFIEKNPAIKKASSFMKDADTLLYGIYRNAAMEGRGLNSLEKQQVIDINSGKIRFMQGE
jgi:hypothetical protein